MSEPKEQKVGQKIGVVGSGLMGHGIAYLLAAVGHHVDARIQAGILKEALIGCIERLGARIDGQRHDVDARQCLRGGRQRR